MPYQNAAITEEILKALAGPPSCASVALRKKLAQTYHITDSQNSLKMSGPNGAITCHGGARVSLAAQSSP